MSVIASGQSAISTSHHLATEAGAAAMRAGGNAVDAALAAAATLCVVYPNNVALGGDLVALVRSPDGRVRFLNATGAAPQAQTLEALRSTHGDQLPLRGIDTVTVPGGVCGWNSLHEYGATRSWADHFEHAIRHASEGFPNSRSVANALIDDRVTLEQDPGAAAVFYPDGKPVAKGETLRQPALAETLRRVAEYGSGEFYEGRTAVKWIAGLQKLGSKITLQDAIDYSAYWGEPLEGEFGDLRVLTGPPNTSGFMLLRALNAINGTGGSPGIEDPLGTGAGELARAFDDANIVRAASLADPRMGGACGPELVEMDASGLTTRGLPKASGDTVGLSAASADGWAVSLINSVYWGFGAHILEPETGIIFQNRGTSFSLDPTSPNAFAPGKRPRHTLMPVLVLRGSDLAWVPATMGGAAQPQIHTQLLVRSVSGATPSEATHTPRWIVDERRGDNPPSVTVEEGVTEETRLALEQAGFTVNIVPDHSEDLGHSNLIRIADDNVDASSDPRSDGSAIVF
ncbi:gamma-glutamyltransferase family protein [Leucobacter denitrificans]|uniref:Gamma-glutamyltransferase n=1 Tax=Leucobacter denitrificans TaxID=683042 RepID=A0A7G9S2K3_9MICO|nr:gamma-glutamyltransferase [Leucobacter denitrificans]QNN62078.1 gamma-glutamyltransferase [Leucobacter denitrificans]